MLGDFRFIPVAPSLRHMAQVPIAPLAADIQALLQDPPAQPDAQPDAPAVQPVALQTDGLQPPPGNQLAVVQPAAEVPAQGAAQPAGPELVGSIYFLFHFLYFFLVRAGFGLAHALSPFIRLLSCFSCLFESILLQSFEFHTWRRSFHVCYFA